MKKVAVFKIPTEIEAANEFLSKNPPEQVAVVNEMLVINYDDQTYPAAYKAEELRGLILSNTKQLMTSAISEKVTRHDLDRYSAMLAELNQTVVTTKNGKQKYDISKDREEKIKKYTELIKNLTIAVTGLKESILLYEMRNKVMQEMIDDLDL